MSEVPEGDSGPNPFSFKNFVKRGSTAEKSASAVRGQRSGRPAKKAEDPSKRKKKKSGGGGEVEDVPFPDLGAKSDAGKVAGEEDNPFSFTKFVKRKEAKQTVPSRAQKDTSESSDDSDNDIIVHPPRIPSGKPSPAQSKKTSRTSSSSSILTSVPPKVAPPTSSGVHPTAKTSSSAKRTSVEKRETPKLFPDSDSSSSDEGDSLFSRIPKPPVAMDSRTKVGGAVLEDLFDDPPAVGRGESLLLANKKGDSSSDESLSSPPEVTVPLPLALDISEGVVSGTALEQLSKLKAENLRLEKELQQSREETRLFKDKNTSLKQKMKALKKKEAEETKALEEMVLKVESNLETTTKRALTAEATIVRLKQEISTLQTKLAQITPESVQQHYEEMLMGVREKANYSSQQLVLAAQMADQSIKELAGGVDTLKNVAEILQFIDNICELKDKTP